MVLLTPASWPGLPLYFCPAGRPVRLLDIELGDSLLVLWRNPGTAVEVRRAANQRWRYQSRIGHFDFLLAGRFESILCTPPTKSALIVGLPRDRIHALLQGCAEHASAMPKESQFQFRDRALKELVTTLEAHHHAGEPLGPLYTRGVSTVIADRLAALAGLRARDGGRLRPAACRVLMEVIENRVDAPPDLAELAALTGMSPNRFLKSFKMSFGVTPHSYIVKRRIEKAKELLTPPNGVSLTSLALQLGFNSHAHFTSVFRTHTGVTPSVYRRWGHVPIGDPVTVSDQPHRRSR